MSKHDFRDGFCAKCYVEEYEAYIQNNHKDSHLHICPIPDIITIIGYQNNKNLVVISHEDYLASCEMVIKLNREIRQLKKENEK